MLLCACTARARDTTQDYVTATLVENPASKVPATRRRQCRWDLGSFRVVYLATVEGNKKIAKYLINPRARACRRRARHVLARVRSTSVIAHTRRCRALYSSAPLLLRLSGPHPCIDSVSTSCIRASVCNPLVTCWLGVRRALAGGYKEDMEAVKSTVIQYILGQVRTHRGKREHKK